LSELKKMTDKRRMELAAKYKTEELEKKKEEIKT
jgi:hypothetical protein